jgi:hypothetical protein
MLTILYVSPGQIHNLRYEDFRPVFRATFRLQEFSDFSPHLFLNVLFFRPIYDLLLFDDLDITPATKYVNA